MNMIEIDRLKHLATVAFETGSRILYFHPGNEADIDRCVIWHQYTSQRPVHHIHAIAVTRTDSHISPLLRAGGI